MPPIVPGRRRAKAIDAIYLEEGFVSFLLAYRPFLDPLPVWPKSVWPWLLVPLCVAVAIVYKSVRCKTMDRVPREAGELAITILLGMAAAAVVLGVIVRGFVE
jgi:hypothetical protein